MFLRPPQLEASATLLLASPHKVSRNCALRDPANLRDGNVPMLGVLIRRMLERSGEARDL
jgi:hypothetical protein